MFYKDCRWGESNPDSLKLDATALPEPTSRSQLCWQTQHLFFLRIGQGMELFSMRRWTSAQHSCNVSMHVLHMYWGRGCHKHNSLPFGTIQPSSPLLKSSMDMGIVALTFHCDLPTLVTHLKKFHFLLTFEWSQFHVDSSSSRCSSDSTLFLLGYMWSGTEKEPTFTMLNCVNA